MLGLKNRSEGEYHDRNSKFLGIVLAVKDEKEAQAMIKETKAEHAKANHLCYAYRVKKDKQIVENLSDDGEPTHSAGQPILRQLQAENLVNALAMVVRYYGGINLGVGGLIKAYKNATRAALEGAELIEIKEINYLQFKVDYSLWGRLMGVLDKENLKFQLINHNDHAEVSIEIEDDNDGRIKELLASSGVNID